MRRWREQNFSDEYWGLRVSTNILEGFNNNTNLDIGIHDINKNITK